MEELNKKIQLAMESDFIGDINFTEEEIDIMKIHCQGLIKSSFRSYAVEDICELIVLIVNLSKNWGDEAESRFWVKLFGEIFEDASVSPAKFYDEFDYCLKKYNKTLFRSRENRRMFREVFLLHALAPEKSSESFIRLLWNWFCDEDVINFDYQPKDIIFEQIAKFLKSEFGGAIDLDEDIDFEGKTYSIKAAFKYLFSQDTERGVLLLDRLFSNIDDAYFNGSFNENSYYADVCNRVVEKILLESNIKKGRRKRTHTEHVISEYSKIYAGYEIDENGNSYLFIPEIRAIDEIAEEYRIEITNSKQEIVYYDDGYIVGNNLKRKIKRIAIPLSNIIGHCSGGLDITVKLSVIRDGKRFDIYNSQKSLYRDFILFYNKRETRSQNRKPEPHYLVHAIDFIVKDHTNCEIVSKNRFTSALFAKENDYLYSTNQQVFFNTVPKDSHIEIEGKQLLNATYWKDGENCPIYKQVNNLFVMIQKANISGISVLVDDKYHYPLVECSTFADNKYCINLETINASANGLHKILISDVSKNKLLHTCMFYVDSCLRISMTRDTFVFGVNKITLSVISCNEGESTILYSANVKSGNKTVDINYNDGTIVVDIPYLRWRIDNGDWNYAPLNSKIWHKESFLHNNCILEIDNKSKKDIVPKINNVAIPRSAKDNRFLLGDALVENKSKEKNVISLVIDGEKTELFQVINEETIINVPEATFPIDLENKTIDLSSYFIGDDDARFLITIKNEERKYEIETNIKDTVDVDILDDVYDIKVCLIDYFGINKVIYNQELIDIGNPYKFCFNNCKVLLTKFIVPSKGKYKPENSYIMNLEYLRIENIGIVYSGKLYSKKKSYDVELYIKDESSLKFYFTKGEELLPVYFDNTQKSFVLNSTNDTSVILCTSCYYDVEEV